MSTTKIHRLVDQHIAKLKQRLDEEMRSLTPNADKIEAMKTQIRELERRKVASS